MTGNFKWVLLAVVCLIVVGFLRGLTLSPQERAAREEQRAKAAQWEERRKGREG